MCSSVVYDAIKSVLNQKMQDNDLFTAHDITRAVRDQLGRSINVKHNEVRSEVHNFFADGEMSNYTRSLANFTGLNQQPFVYHPVGADPDTYGFASSPTKQQPVLVVVNDNEDEVDDAVILTKNGHYQVDARERLCVPAAMLRDINLNPGDNANVYADALLGRVIVCKDSEDTSTFTPLSTYTVDKYGNVRIAQQTLMTGGCGGKEFAIVGDSNKVSIVNVC